MFDYHDLDLKPLTREVVFADKAVCKGACCTNGIGHEHALRGVKRNHYVYTYKYTTTHALIKQQPQV